MEKGRATPALFCPDCNYHNRQNELFATSLLLN